MDYKLFIARRYLRRRLTAVLAVVSVTFGVATLLTTLSIMEGYIIRLREIIRGRESHLMVLSRTPQGLCDMEAIDRVILEDPGVAVFGEPAGVEGATPRRPGTAPSVETFAMYRSDTFSPCFLRSIEPEREFSVTNLGNAFFHPGELEGILALLEAEGSPAELQARAEERAREVLADESRRPFAAEDLEALFSADWRREIIRRLPPAIGARLLERRLPSAVVVGIHFLAERHLAIGQVIKIMSLKPGTSELVEGNFLVTGAFKTGLFDLDSHLFFIHNRRMMTFLRTVRPPLNEPCFDKIRIALKDHREAPEAKFRIQRALMKLPRETGGPESVVVTWEDQKRILLQAVAWEKLLLGIVLSLLNVFTGCVILFMLVLLVIEKVRDAGILLALGATPFGVFQIFLLNGLVITCVGAAAGVGLGILFVSNINTLHDWIYLWTGYRLFDQEVYLMDQIPYAITPVDIALSILPALVFGFAASLIPAIWAARKDPVQAIHNE